MRCHERSLKGREFGATGAIRRFFVLVVLTAVFTNPARADDLSNDLSNDVSDEVSNEASSGTVGYPESLIRIWSTVRVSHPWVGEDLSGWDRAFVKAVEQSLDGADCDSFGLALREMLESLGDPETRVAQARNRNDAGLQPVVAERAIRPALSWLDEQTAIIDVRDWLGLTIGAGGLNAMHNPMFVDVFAEAESARTLVLDLRRTDRPAGAGGFDSGAFMLSAVLRRELPLILKKPLVMPTTASRQHYGYSNQGITSEFYHSGHYIRDHKLVEAENTNAGKPAAIAVWINEPESDAHLAIVDLIAALQDSGNGIVVAASKRATHVDPYAYPVPVLTACGFEARLRTSVMVNSDGSFGFSPAAFVQAGGSDKLWLNATEEAFVSDTGDRPAGGRRFPLVAESDPKYEGMRELSVGYRLLALAKFWSAFNHFSPYKELTDRPWDATLAEFIPKFIAARDDLEYAKLVAKLGVETNDSHTSISAPALTEYFGTATVPIIAREIEGRSVVVWTGDDEALMDVERGDIIVSIDGQAAADRLSDLLSLTPGSNRAARVRNAHSRMFHGRPGSLASITLKDGDGRSRKVTIRRTDGAAGRWVLYRASKTADAAAIVSDDIGYIDIPRVGPADLEGVIESTAGARDFIFDMRGYPNLPVTDFLAELSDSSGVGALIAVPIVRSVSQDTSTKEVSRQRFFADADAPIPGHVVILVNRWTQSAAEHAALFLKSAFGDRAVIAGEPSAGANGTITYAYLPGGVTVSFTGMSVAWANGDKLQRLGIIPNIVARPTIRGIREGRDEVLEAAIAHLESVRSVSSGSVSKVGEFADDGLRYPGTER